MCEALFLVRSALFVARAKDLTRKIKIENVGKE